MWTSDLLSFHFSSGIEFCVTLDPKTGWSLSRVSLRNKNTQSSHSCWSLISIWIQFFEQPHFCPVVRDCPFCKDFLVWACCYCWNHSGSLDLGSLTAKDNGSMCFLRRHLGWNNFLPFCCPVLVNFQRLAEFCSREKTSFFQAWEKPEDITLLTRETAAALLFWNLTGANQKEQTSNIPVEIQLHFMIMASKNGTVNLLFAQGGSEELESCSN